MSRPPRDALASIELVVLDVDGVLTDGSLIYGEAGESHKSFHVRDGAGIARLIRAGIEVAVISGRDSGPLRARLDDLGIEHRDLACHDKGAAIDALMSSRGLAAASVLAMGDDDQDAPMLERAGVAVAVADAAPALLAHADWITRGRGGRGAVREVADAILDARTHAHGFHVVIPSRYGASRLPGKPLATIAGKPMIEHVWARAVESGSTDIIVAADDERIRAAVEGFGGQCMMTSPAHTSGTDRIAEVALALGWGPDDIVVNLQGDEPALLGEHIRRVAKALDANPWAAIATLAAPITTGDELVDPNAVKVTVADNGRALAFSRAPIPWVRDSMRWGETPTIAGAVPFLRHIGLYAYRVKSLLQIADADPAAIEMAESLEQLRALVLGLDIHVTIVKKAPPAGVDTENDLARLDRLMTSA